MASSRAPPSRGVLPRAFSPRCPRRSTGSGVRATARSSGDERGVAPEQDLTSRPPRRCRVGRRPSARGTSLLPRPLWSRLTTGPGPTAARRSPAWRGCCAAPAGKDRPGDPVSPASPWPVPVLSKWLSGHLPQTGFKRHFSNFRGRTAVGAWPTKLRSLAPPRR